MTEIKIAIFVAMQEEAKIICDGLGFKKHSSEKWCESQLYIDEKNKCSWSLLAKSRLMAQE